MAAEAVAGTRAASCHWCRRICRPPLTSWPGGRRKPLATIGAEASPGDDGLPAAPAEPLARTRAIRALRRGMGRLHVRPPPDHAVSQGYVGTDPSRGELPHGGLRKGLVHIGKHHARGSLDELLCLPQAKPGKLAHHLDRPDLVVADALEHDVATASQPEGRQLRLRLVPVHPGRPARAPRRWLPKALDGPLEGLLVCRLAQWGQTGGPLQVVKQRHGASL